MRSTFLILAFIIVAIPTKLTAISELSCVSIHTLDLQNANINDINFEQGKAYTSDGSNPKDWEHTLSTDQILKPTANREIRLIVINSNHLTGSGAWDTVIAFDCVQGALNKIFEKKYLYGVKIEIRQDDELLLTSGEWQPTDPMCFPSKEKIETYQWNQFKGTYLLKETVIQKVRKSKHVEKSFVDAKENVHIVYSSGEDVQITQDGRCEDLKVDKAQQLVGWVHRGTVEDEKGRVIEEFRAEIVVYQNEHDRKVISGDMTIWNWKFWENGRIAFCTGPTHGYCFFRLYDLESGHVIDECNKSDSTDCPAWAKDL